MPVNIVNHHMDLATFFPRYDQDVGLVTLYFPIDLAAATQGATLLDNYTLGFRALMRWTYYTCTLATTTAGAGADLVLGVDGVAVPTAALSLTTAGCGQGDTGSGSVLTTTIDPDTVLSLTSTLTGNAFLDGIIALEWTFYNLDLRDVLATLGMMAQQA
jgi:hypothetical protein